MKKIITLIITFLILITAYNVQAANYELKELIPIDTKTTIVTKKFSYKQLYYDSNTNKIHFEGIKNISEEERPISFSIAFFDEKKKNVGLVNYCDKNNNILQSKTEIIFELDITKGYLGEEFTSNDIKYIALLEDNTTCKVDGSQLYIGQKVEEIGKYHNGELSASSELTVKVIGFIAGFIAVIFIYQFLFTNKYKNMDGDEIRDVLKNYKNENARADTFAINDQHSEIVDNNTIINKSKTSEMADKEALENDKSKRKENDLYDMYK